MSNKILVFCFFSFIALLALSLNSCRYSESFYEGNDAIVEFSRDTVRFDTVFTTVGSATRSFKITNPLNETLLVSRINLENSQNSFFRLNVNGVNGSDVENVEIRAKDSIYVFAEVSIDPDQPLSASPFIIEEYVNVEVNGNSQRVLLEAWGQNANYVPSNTARGGFALLSCDNETEVWDDPKPYVIYGILFIDSCTLELPPDCNIYVHGGIATREDIGTYNDGRIIVLKDGRIDSKGTAEFPVLMQGDRLEPEYFDVAAQWTGIQIYPESKNNSFEHTIIRDGITGISVDSAASVSLESVQIFNHASRSFVGFHAKDISINNSLFHSTSGETVLIKYGGNVSIDYSTIAGFSNQQSAFYADNFRCTGEIFCGPVLINPLNLQMRNTIIAGNGSDELTLSDGTFNEVPDVLNFEMSNCFIKMDTLLNANNFPNFFDNCTNCASIKNEEALFASSDELDFHLDTLSQVEMRGLAIPGVIEDLEDNTRDTQNPDVGCYEYQ